MNYQIPEEFRRLQIASSTDKCRYNLNGVYFNGTEAVATDGHILAVRKKPAPQQHGESPPLPENSIYQFSSAKPKKSKLNLFRELSQDKILNEETGEMASKVDGSFPNYKQITERTISNEVTLSFNVRFLARLVEAISADPKSREGMICSITFDSKDGLAPMKVTTRDSSAYGMLMPCRSDRKFKGD